MEDAALADALRQLDAGARSDLRRLLIRDQPDRDAIANQLLRRRTPGAHDLADLIDLLTMGADARRRVVRPGRSLRRVRVHSQWPGRRARRARVHGQLPEVASRNAVAPVHEAVDVMPYVVRVVSSVRIRKHFPEADRRAAAHVSLAAATETVTGSATDGVSPFTNITDGDSPSITMIDGVRRSSVSPDASARENDRLWGRKRSL